MNGDATMGNPSLELIRDLEGAAARCWPAAVVEPFDGWLLRCDGGSTKRANSVLPLAAGVAIPAEQRLARVETFYRRRGLPARYQLTAAAQPLGLDNLLAARGYHHQATTWVQTADAEDVLARTDGRGHPVRIRDQADETWLSALAEVTKTRADETAVYERLAGRAGHACLCRDGVPLAVGLGVHEGDWVGVFCMATVPAFRRLGAATAVLHALAAWGRQRGVARLFLQVLHENTPAQALYARAGFTPLYAYHYREQAEAVPVKKDPV
jgi:ribosomal protein S18 acetylase RimI-like enzyme